MLLAMLLTLYALGGSALAALMFTARQPDLEWRLLGGAGALFALTAGTSALSIWRRERRAPVILGACAVGGALLCLALPAAAPPLAATPELWRAAVLGAVLWVAFLAVAALYVHRRLREHGG
jgi:hypothetical protein